MTNITYVVGDATQPVGDGPKVIAHVCNDAGGWGRGFVVALSRRWSEPEYVYREWYRQQHIDGWHDAQFKLGRVRFARVVPSDAPGGGIVVANMIAQRGIRHDPTAPAAIDYLVLRQCLEYVGDVTVNKGESVHMPRIGCGLGGGSWEVVEEIIHDHLIDQGVPVTVYDLPGSTFRQASTSEETDQ